MSCLTRGGFLVDEGSSVSTISSLMTINSSMMKVLMALVSSSVSVVRLPKSDSMSPYVLSFRWMFSPNNSMLEAKLVNWKLTSLVVSRDRKVRLIR